MLIGCDNFGGCVGEGLAAVRGYQSGAKGRGLRCPRSPREIETISDRSIRFPAFPPFFYGASRTPRPTSEGEMKRTKKRER